MHHISEDRVGIHQGCRFLLLKSTKVCAVLCLRAQNSNLTTSISAPQTNKSLPNLNSHIYASAASLDGKVMTKNSSFGYARALDFSAVLYVVWTSVLIFGTILIANMLQQRLPLGVIWSPNLEVWPCCGSEHGCKVNLVSVSAP